KQAVGQVTAVTGRDVVPPILTAVRLELGPDRLRLAATDKYRIALREVPWTGPVDPVRALVPAHQLAATAAALDPAGEWSLGVEAGTVLTIRDGRRTCTLRLIDGAYPPIESVVPESFAGAVQVERAALTEAIRRVSLAGDEGGRGAVVLAGGPGGSLEVTGGSGTSRGRQRLPCRHSGPDVHAAFTASYLAGVLASIPQEQVLIRLDPGIGKVLVTASEEVGYQHVLMSRRLPGQ
ncbi:MAG TPA: DNA polymerase III subunit beta, partial [Mycobacteriales bacterium]|nr:DNA polymerase III subunit beta [Mycobacteriales bacterium]